MPQSFRSAWPTVPSGSLSAAWSEEPLGGATASNPLLCARPHLKLALTDGRAATSQLASGVPSAQPSFAAVFAESLAPQGWSAAGQFGASRAATVPDAAAELHTAFRPLRISDFAMPDALPTFKL